MYDVYLRSGFMPCPCPTTYRALGEGWGEYSGYTWRSMSREEL